MRQVPSPAPVSKTPTVRRGPASVHAQSGAAFTLRKRTAANGYVRRHSRPCSHCRRFSSVTIILGLAHALFPARSEV